MAALSDFNLLLVIANNSLIAYRLDAIFQTFHEQQSALKHASMKISPQKLSGSWYIGFFATARLKDRFLVFYKTGDVVSSSFKILEPIVRPEKGRAISRWLPTSRQKQTGLFREYDEFYIPAPCYGINVFRSSFAVLSNRGIEVLTLDKKQPWSVPNLKADNLRNQEVLDGIASRIQGLRPLGMFRISDTEFLCTYESCAVYVNNHGDISRAVVMDIIGRANSACLYDKYLILFSPECVQIRDAHTGRLRQLIVGQDISMLDDGRGEAKLFMSASLFGVGGDTLQDARPSQPPSTVNFRMRHPLDSNRYLLLQLELRPEHSAADDVLGQDPKTADQVASDEIF